MSYQILIMAPNCSPRHAESRQLCPVPRAQQTPWRPSWRLQQVAPWRGCHSSQALRSRLPVGSLHLHSHTQLLLRGSREPPADLPPRAGHEGSHLSPLHGTYLSSPWGRDLRPSEGSRHTRHPGKRSWGGHCAACLLLLRLILQFPQKSCDLLLLFSHSAVSPL